MESYFTLLARLVVIAFVAFAVSAAITPTAKRIGLALSGTVVIRADEDIPAPVVPIDHTPLIFTAIGIGLFTICATGFCYSRVRKLKLALDQIKRLSGNVNLVPNFSSLTLSWLHCKTTVDLSRSTVSDADLPNLSALPRLESLRIASTAVTDQSAQLLSRCRYLKSLDISDTKIGDESIAKISKLPHLETLIASQTQITDNCIVSISDMPQLRKFECTETEISPEGLQQLEEIAPQVKFVV